MAWAWSAGVTLLLAVLYMEWRKLENRKGSELEAAPRLNSEDRIPCPRCTSRRPKFRMMEASTIYRVKGSAEGEQLVEKINGYRLACQDCPTVFMVGPEGTYYPHEDSLPLMRKVGTPPFVPTGNGHMERAALDDVGSGGPLVGKPRPRV